MDSLNAAPPAPWTPVRVYANGGDPVVEWAIVGEPLREPFFEQNVDRAMRHPFNELFARRTGIAAVEAAHAEGGVTPAGFVFHLSRCGSTLIAQMLSRMRGAVVLSEAQPIDALLRMRAAMAAAGREDELARRLRALVGTLGRGHAGERRLFVKFHAWHVLELPFLARAFPDVPWTFVFREPRAVLHSQMREPGAELVAGALDPALLGFDREDVGRMGQDEYGARVLAAFCAAALRGAHEGAGSFVEYAGLPEAVFTHLLPLFGVAASAGDAERMREVTVRDAKRPGTIFAPRPFGADATIDELAARWLDAPYAALRAAAARSAAAGR